MVARALRECKPAPMPKFEPKVIEDLNPDFWINQNSDPDVCRICPKMLWMHYLVGVSHFAKWYKSAVDCMRNAKKCPKIPYWWRKWQSDPESTRGSRSPPNADPDHHQKLITSRRSPFAQSCQVQSTSISTFVSVILFTEWQTERSHNLCLDDGGNKHHSKHWQFKQEAQLLLGKPTVRCYF